MPRPQWKRSVAGGQNRLFVRLIGTALVLICTANGASAEDWELLATRKAADLLPADSLTGEHYRIGDAVETDGFLNFYDLQTDYGPFAANSDWELEIRLGEVAAMAELSKITKSKAVTKGLADSAMAPVDAAGDLVTDPVGTVKSVGKGVGNLFRRTKRVAKQATAKKKPDKTADQATDEGKEGEGKPSKEKQRSAADVALGTDKQERLWAYKLRIDPYSDNEVVRAELARVAKASAVGGASFKLRSFDTIEGGLQGVSNELYTLGVKDLQARNEKIFTDAGFTAESFVSFEPFFESPHLSPTFQTIIIDCFARLAGVEGREELIALAAAMESVDEARFQVAYMEFLATLHEKTPLQRIQAGLALPAAWTRDGEVILVMAADHLSWTENLVSALRAHLDEFNLASRDKNVVLYLAGDATTRATEGLAAMGIEVRTSEF